jgi:hypothetical protein
MISCGSTADVACFSGIQSTVRPEQARQSDKSRAVKRTAILLQGE